MGLSAFYSSARDVTPEKAKAVVHHAVNEGKFCVFLFRLQNSISFIETFFRVLLSTWSGVTLLNSATFYGPLNETGFGANLRLLKTAIEGIDRSKIQLMVKIGMDTR